MYCHGDDHPVGDPIKNLVQHRNDHQIPLLIGADSNSHSSFWGHDTPDDRGEAFEDFILGYELDLLNDTTRPTYHQGDKHTAIDITLVNYYALNSGFISNWVHRDDDFTLSDHDRLDIDINTTPVIEQVYCRNFTKMDWRLFRLLLDEKLAEVADDADADSLLDHLYTSIESALDATAPYGLR